MDNAELGRALDQVRLRLEDRGKGLIEIGRHLAEIFAAIGLRRQSQGDTDLVNIGQRLGDLRAGGRQRLLRAGRTPGGSRPASRSNCLRPIEIELVPASESALLLSRAATRACSRAIWFSTSSMACCNFQRRLLGLCFDTAHRGVGRLQVRLCGIDGRFLLRRPRSSKRLLVQFGEKIAFAHAVVVIHQNPGNLAADAGRDESHMAVHVSVVGRNGVERCSRIQGMPNTQTTARTTAPSSADQQPSPPRRADDPMVGLSAKIWYRARPKRLHRPSARLSDLNFVPIRAPLLGYLTGHGMFPHHAAERSIDRHVEAGPSADFHVLRWPVTTLKNEAAGTGAGTGHGTYSRSSSRSVQSCS